MRISDWSSDVCSSDLRMAHRHRGQPQIGAQRLQRVARAQRRGQPGFGEFGANLAAAAGPVAVAHQRAQLAGQPLGTRSEEHTSELQSLMRNSYAVFCLKKKTKSIHNPTRKIKHTKHCKTIKTTT